MAPAKQLTNRECLEVVGKLKTQPQSRDVWFCASGSWLNGCTEKPAEIDAHCPLPLLTSKSVSQSKIVHSGEKEWFNYGGSDGFASSVMLFPHAISDRLSDW